MTAADFTVPEGRLADALGLPRKQLKGVRADVLEQGADWAYVDNGAVCYSRPGVERTLANLGIAPEKIALVMPAAPAPAAPAAEIEAVSPCEGCGEPSTTSDGEGVFLCAECAACLTDEPEEDSAANELDLLPFARLGFIEALRRQQGRLAVAEVVAELDLSEPAGVTVTVTRCFTVNRRLVAGLLGEDAVRVRVKNNQNLRVGMELRCIHVEADLYELAERLPRWANKR